MKGLSECKASESNVRRIQVKDIVKKVEDCLKTYSSAGMDISWEDNKSKKYKSSGSSSFNTRHSREGHFNLNTTAKDEEDEVHEVHPRRPMGRDQAKKKGKGVTSSTSSATAVNVEALARLMVNEYAMANDPYKVQRAKTLHSYYR
ncbi:hypothetical protein Tco_0542420 [Tanacetum coccineum]